MEQTFTQELVQFIREKTVDRPRHTRTSKAHYTIVSRWLFAAFIATFALGVVGLFVVAVIAPIWLVLEIPGAILLSWFLWSFWSWHYDRHDLTHMSGGY
ncbi:membrane protein [Microbacterium phage Cece]|nr:membrane protein [Microbacterium phage Cece]